MKKCALLLAVLLCLSATICGCGEKVPVQTPAYLFDYHINSEKEYVVINGYYGDDSNVIIPSEIEGYKVLGIGYWAFWQNNKIESVTLPDSVEVISLYAFALCEKLHTINFGEGLNTIDENAFQLCTSLENITFTGEPILIRGGFTFGSPNKNVKIYYPKNKPGWGKIITDDYTYISY